MIDEDFDPIEWAAPICYDAGCALPELGRVALVLLGAVVVAAALVIAMVRGLRRDGQNQGS